MVMNGIKITLLMEDTCQRNDLCAEHGLSMYVETSHHKIIMDTGSSELTWENASVLGVDIEKADTVVISHGHYDHAGGLLSLNNINNSAKVFIMKTAFGDFFHGDRYIGIDKRIYDIPELNITNRGVTEIDGELTLFSGIDGKKLIPRGNSLLTVRSGGSELPDSFDHEQYLAVNVDGKKAVLSGCAHNGILNILDKYKGIYGEYPDAVISGFHMMKNGAYSCDEIDEIKQTAEMLSKMPCVFYTCHCTGEQAYVIMKRIMGEQLHDIHAGDIITL